MLSDSLLQLAEREIDLCSTMASVLGVREVKFDRIEKVLMKLIR
jgi:hypothetical protein